MKLTPHEEKILNLIKENPNIIDNPDKRQIVAKRHGLTEKTLRNRIAEFKKRNLIGNKKIKQRKSKQPLITDNDEINISVIWSILYINKKIVTKIAILFTCVGLVYSLLATIYFESEISLYPAGELSQSGGLLGDFQGLAKSFGMGSLGNAPTYNIPDIIKSRSLKKDIVQKKWQTKKYPSGSNLVKYWELDQPSLLSYPLRIFRSFLPSGGFNTSKIDKETFEAIIELDELISVKEEISGLISVAVLMEDPQLASDIANYIAEYVKNFISIEQKREASRNRVFIEKQMEEARKQTENSEDALTDFRKNHPLRLDTPQIEMMRERHVSTVEENRAVYITLRQQFEIAKIDEAKERLLINILDTAEPAVKKTKPKRTLIVILSLIFGFFLAIPYTIYLDRKEN
ncbi:MAG: GNVR domain-containing protein [Candidatus Neomarinimicrobiota bacterium]